MGRSNSVHDLGDAKDDPECDWDNAAYPDRCMNEEWWGLVGISADPAERRLRPGYHLMQSALNPRTFVRGDANCDGAVDIADAIYALRYLFTQGPSPACLDTADANDDAQIDISDAVKTLLVLFVGLIMPEPADQPGPDPTLDLLTCLSSCPLQ
jgi:hypothetical protein